MKTSSILIFVTIFACIYAVGAESTCDRSSQVFCACCNTCKACFKDGLVCEEGKDCMCNNNFEGYDCDCSKFACSDCLSSPKDGCKGEDVGSCSGLGDAARQCECTHGSERTSLGVQFCLSSPRPKRLGGDSQGQTVVVTRDSGWTVMTSVSRTVLYIYLCMSAIILVFFVVFMRRYKISWYQLLPEFLDPASYRKLNTKPMNLAA